MTALALALRFLHVLAAATWLGAALWAAGDVRRTLAQGQPFVTALAARTRPALRLDFWSGIGTVVTGMALIGVLYAGMPPVGILVGFVAAVVRLLLQALVAEPALRRVTDLITAGDLAAAAAPAKRLGMISGIGHLLWIVALAGMIFRF
jgi:hypothetical protein